MAASVEATATAVQQLARGQLQASQSTADTQKGMQSAAAGLQEMTALAASMRKDTESLATSA
jgi:hypothetical protein